MHRITKFCFAKVVLLGAAVAAVGVLGAATPARAAVGNCTPDAAWGVADATLASQVVALVNQHRQALGLATLAVSPTLTASADWKSLHMGYYGYLQHDDPAPPVARTVSDRLAACAYPIGTVGWGENIAYGYATPQAVMTAWLNSSGHRANIENPSYRAIGVGVARGLNGLYYWTQDFGTLLDSATTPPVPTVTAPTVALTSGPPLSTSSTSASFAWSTSGSPTSVTCSLDGGAAATCSSPRTYAGLAAGTHRFVVRVANTAGSASATYGWTVTSTSTAGAPTVTLTSTPSATTTASSASFAWSTSGSPTSVTCSLDGAPAFACMSPTSYVGLGAGAHRFVVRVASPYGSASAAYDWTIAATTSGVPVITFTSAPPASTTWTTAIFSWTLSGPATGVTCALDGGFPFACSSPRALIGLTRGTHRFVVTASGSGGSGTRAYTWTVTS